jgi:hypothetical protein
MVMRQGDPSFDQNLQWLLHIQATMNAYQSPEALQLVSMMLRKVKRIQNEELTPIIRNQVASLFDDWEDFAFMQFIFSG